MKLLKSKLVRLHLVAIVYLALTIYPSGSHAQPSLERRVHLQYHDWRISEVLDEIGRQGQFYFAYEGGLVPKDSVVSGNFQDHSILVVLTKLFKDRYVYQERKGYIIISPRLRRLLLSNTDLTEDRATASISGLVLDERTGERLMNASVYEKQQLVETLTDEHGYFRLKLRAGNPSIQITVSKLNYRDTSEFFLQSLAVTRRMDKDVYAKSKNRSNRVERTLFGNILISAKQKIISMNIGAFLAERPFQISLTPGLSTHGNFSPQVVNKFSVNLVGGYTAGVDGVELGGLFNINKESSRYVQLAGIFNLVGGNMSGLQLAAVQNLVLDTLAGVQLSAFANKATAEVNGVQLSLLHNKTSRLKGLQLGLINEADTSEGISIGLLNLIRNGFYKVSYWSNNLALSNIAIKTGTHGFYSALVLSANPVREQQLYAVGIGIGHDLMLSHQLYLSTEASYQFANTGFWDDRWAQAKLVLNLQLAKHISIFGGVTYNKYSYTGSQPGYQERFRLPAGSYASGFDRNPVKRWLGWEGGLAFNSSFRPAEKKIDRSVNWTLGLAAKAGLVWDKPYNFVSGAEISIKRELGDYLAGTLTTGYTHLQAKPEIGLNEQHKLWSKEKPVQIVPLKAGIEKHIKGRLYFAGAIGLALGSASAQLGMGQQATLVDRSFQSFMYSLSTGLGFANGIEAGMMFEDFGIQSPYKQLALRLGYRFSLNK